VTDPVILEIFNILLSRNETLSAAESCTGGWISKEITSIPGSSSVFWGSAVSYSNNSKTVLLDVDPLLIEKAGAVSSGVAKSMAWGIKKVSGSDWSISVTGIAGPGGGTPEKPVGTIWIGIGAPDGKLEARMFNFKGSRQEIRRKSVIEAFKMLYKQLDT